MTRYTWPEQPQKRSIRTSLDATCGMSTGAICRWRSPRTLRCGRAGSGHAASIPGPSRPADATIRSTAHAAGSPVQRLEVAGTPGQVRRRSRGRRTVASGGDPGRTEDAICWRCRRRIAAEPADREHPAIARRRLPASQGSIAGELIRQGIRPAAERQPVAMGQK